jgi:hypothetical protein
MKYIIALIVILIAILFLYKQQENLDASGLSNEALQNIAKVYGDTSGTVTFNNVGITSKLDVNGDSLFGGKVVFKEPIQFGGKIMVGLSTRGAQLVDNIRPICK